MAEDKGIMSAELRLGESHVKQVMEQAILQLLPPAAREKILADAIARMNEPQGYNKEKPLVVAFMKALGELTEAIAREILAGDTKIREQVEGVVREGIDRVLVQNREQTIAALAKNIGDAVSKARVW